MKRLFVIMAAALPALLLSVRTNAQELKSTYFLDDYVYKYEINPAMHDEKTTKVFVGFGLNNIGVSAKANVGADNFIFVRNNELVYFMNDKVSAAEFLGGLPDAGVKLNMNVNLSLLSFGFKVGPHGFLSFDTRFRTKENTSVSKDFFGQLMKIKEGSGLDTGKGARYNFQSIGVGADVYLEQAIGYSFQVAEGLRLGATLKGLFGLASVGAELKNVDVEFVEDDVAKVNSSANMYASSELLAFPQQGNIPNILNPGYSQKFGVSGYGGAVDLGVNWESNFGLSVSAAVLDLGGIAWKKGLHGKAELAGEIIGKKPEGMSDDEYTNRIVNNVFDIKTTPVTEFGMLPATFNAGVRYKMPFYKGLSVGVYGDYQLQTGNYDVRGGLTISPCRWFSFTANYGWTNFGGTLGAAMNLRPGPFTFFAGAETCFYNFDTGLPFGKVNTTAKLGVLISVKTPKS